MDSHPALQRAQRALARLAGLTTAVAALLPPAGRAQTAPAPSRLPGVVVSAQKDPLPLESAPLSVTAATRAQLEDAGTRAVSDAAAPAPNTYLAEFSARKLSNPRFRGLGSSPNNPSVTTTIDGVPQLNANTSSLELLAVDQIEFVRGPQGALHGRNTLGGLIALTSTRPALDRAQGGLLAGFGDHGQREARVDVSAPLVAGQAAVSFAAGYAERDGFATNPLTGHDLDFRAAWFGKAQALLRFASDWEARLIVSGERARDGDYRLNDLLAVRANPAVTPRNFEGFTHRDVLAPTLLLTGRTGAVNVALTTGFVSWKTNDATDLDYSPLPLLERGNAERGRQFTQEIRFSSPASAGRTLGWQAGAFLFTQDYEQDAFTFLPNPAFLGYPAGTPALRSHTQARLEDRGAGLFGQVTLRTSPALSLSLGLRADFEDKEAALRTFTTPAGLGAGTSQDLGDDFSELSPHAVASYQLTPVQLVYTSVARGYKAGGFNAASPAGTERFGPEASWNYEAGYKATALDQRLRATLAVFHTRWDDLQLNVPTLTPGQFYVANVGAAATRGIELELTARPAPGWDIFAGAGRLSAKFRTGSRSTGASVGGNRLPFSPDSTLHGGTQYTFTVAPGAQRPPARGGDGVRQVLLRRPEHPGAGDLCAHPPAGRAPRPRVGSGRLDAQRLRRGVRPDGAALCDRRLGLCRRKRRPAHDRRIRELEILTGRCRRARSPAAAPDCA